MNKSNKKSAQKSSVSLWRPTPAALRLWLLGAVPLLIGILDVAYRLCSGLRRGAVGIMLTLTYDIECLVAGLAILTGGVLLLDYMERKSARED